MSLNSTLGQIQKAAKFSAQAQRTLTFTGVANLNTWFEPNELESVISNTLKLEGWGITRVEISNQIVGWVAVNYFNYNITIDIVTSIEENPERVKQGLIVNLNTWFSNIDLNLAKDTINPTLNETEGVIGDIKNAILGTNTSADDAINTGGKILGLSLGTIIAVGLGFLLVSSMVKSKR